MEKKQSNYRWIVAAVICALPLSSRLLAQSCPGATGTVLQNPSCDQSDGSMSIDIFLNAGACCNIISNVTYKVNRKNPGGSSAQVQSDVVSIFPADITVNNLSAGSYEVVLTPAGNCSGGSQVITLPALVNQGGSISIATTIVKPTCPGASNGSLQLSLSGGVAPYSVTVTPGSLGSFTNVTDSTPVNIPNISAGTYTVIATDKNDCTNTTEVVVSAQNNVNLNITSATTSAKCNGASTGSIALTITPPGTYTYLWSNGQTTEDINNVFGGTYTVSVTTAGCTQTATATVSQPAAIALTVAKTDISCNGKNDGQLTANPSGGAGSFKYNWSNNATAQTINNLSPGTYSVTVTDANGCTQTTTGHSIMDPGNVAPSIVAPESIPSGSVVSIQINTNNPNFHIKWSIVDAANATVNAPSQGTISASTGTISKTLTLASTRSPGGILFRVEPYRGDPTTGCQGQPAEATITVLPTGGLFIPEIYTPNGDGANDTWNLTLPTGTTGTVSIFNRAGGLVYEGDALSAWDGTGCPDGTYFYVLTLQANGAQTVEKGAVTILRTTR